MSDGKRGVSSIGRWLRAADRNDGLVRAVRAATRTAVGERVHVGDRASDRLVRLIAQAGDERPSAVRELGLGAVRVWQALTDRGHRGADVTVVFTDLVGFSSWALDAGDDSVLALLRAVGSATDDAVRRRGGTVVKSLGDGVMAVFADPAAAIDAGCEAATAVTAITLDGYRPQLRVGVHTGAPRRVRGDYLGVDVNIAARVAAAAGAGEVLASGPTIARVDPDRYATRRRRGFRAKGAPKDLDVYAVVPRY